MAHAFLVGVSIALGFQSLQPVRAPSVCPNFVGSWMVEHVVADPRSRSVGGPPFFLGSTLVIEQDGDRLLVTQTTPRKHPALTFALDGSDSRNTLPDVRGGRSWEFVSYARWEGKTLVIDTAGAWEVKMRWSITPSGELSVQEWAPSIDLGMSMNHTLYSKR